MKFSTSPSEDVANELRVVPSQYRSTRNRSRQYSLGDSYAGPDSFVLPQVTISSDERPESTKKRLESPSPADVSTMIQLHRVPAHTIAGCPFQLMAEVSSAGDACTGVVRFFDQFKLLGTAAIDPDTGIASLPYVFTDGGRRELCAVFDGGVGCSSSRSATESIQIYASSGPSAADIIRIQL